MARIRSVKPSIRTSRVVTSWPFEIRYFWVLLWGYLDDEGRGLDIPKTIAGDCYPLDDDIDAKTVDGWLDVIATTRVNGRQPPLCRYETDGTRYLHSVNWDDNQKPSRPTPSRLPPCPMHEGFSESLSESPSSAHVLEGGGGKREVGRGGALREPFTEPPPWFCQRHPDGTDNPCRGCQKAREKREAYDAEVKAEQARVVERRRKAPKCKQHPTELAANCPACAGERKGRDP